MTKEKFLTVRWNNILTLVLGIPTLLYIVFALSTPVLSDQAAFIGLFLIGVVYWTVVEQHSNMRFAWQRENSADKDSAKQSSTSRIIYFIYNIVYWAPIVLTFTKVIDYRTGFKTFSVILIIRAAANLYRNNAPMADEGEYFALRSP